MRVLIVEDNDLVADAASLALSSGGFAVDRVTSAEHAATAIAVETFDVAVIDIGLPKADGFSLIRGLRADGRTLPILILTARQHVSDKVVAFELGADDFLAKPFEPAELLARCRALVRRSTLANQGVLAIGNSKIDLAGRRLSIGGDEVDLTAREWTVFDHLVRNSGKIVTKERLLQTLASWEKDVTLNAIEVYISRLRLKLKDALNIRTIRGLGYRLEEKK